MKIFLETPLKKIVNLLECGQKGVALMFRFEIFKAVSVTTGD